MWLSRNRSKTYSIFVILLVSLLISRVYNVCVSGTNDNDGVQPSRKNHLDSNKSSGFDTETEGMYSEDDDEEEKELIVAELNEISEKRRLARALQITLLAICSSTVVILLTYQCVQFKHLRKLLDQVDPLIEDEGFKEVMMKTSGHDGIRGPQGVGGFVFRNKDRIAFGMIFLTVGSAFGSYTYYVVAQRGSTAGPSRTTPTKPNNHVKSTLSEGDEVELIYPIPKYNNKQKHFQEKSQTQAQPLSHSSPISVERPEVVEDVEQKQLEASSDEKDTAPEDITIATVTTVNEDKSEVNEANEAIQGVIDDLIDSAVLFSESKQQPQSLTAQHLQEEEAVVDEESLPNETDAPKIIRHQKEKDPEVAKVELDENEFNEMLRVLLDEEYNNTPNSTLHPNEPNETELDAINAIRKLEMNQNDPNEFSDILEEKENVKISGSNLGWRRFKPPSKAKKFVRMPF